MIYLEVDWGNDSMICSLESFCNANNCDDDAVAMVKDLQPNESVTLGGGASPTVRITRIVMDE
jgi:hypothetical protein